MVTQNELTRYSASSCFRWRAGDEQASPGCLVRIYPADNIGQVFELENRCLTIGREADCDIHLHDDSVSRHHATIGPLDGGYVITDLGSTNGVYVGDQRVGSCRLTADDRIRLGNQIFKYLASDHLEAQYHELVYKLMTTDGLTQVFNRRYLLEVLDRELARCRRTGRPLSVLMVDLDRFKVVNDTYGHLAGDEVLVEFACRAKALLRHDEVLARYGGEEFAVLLPDTPVGEAFLAAERLRGAIAAMPIATKRADVAITVSIGLVEAGRDNDEPAIAVLERADMLLYAAKQAGLNRSVAEVSAPIAARGDSFAM